MYTLNFLAAEQKRKLKFRKKIKATRTCYQSIQAYERENWQRLAIIIWPMVWNILNEHRYENYFIVHESRLCLSRFIDCLKEPRGVFNS